MPVMLALAFRRNREQGPHEIALVDKGDKLPLVVCALLTEQLWYHSNIVFFYLMQLINIYKFVGVSSQTNGNEIFATFEWISHFCFLLWFLPLSAFTLLIVFYQAKSLNPFVVAFSCTGFLVLGSHIVYVVVCHKVLEYLNLICIRFRVFFVFTF